MPPPLMRGSYGTSEQLPRGARWREMRMNARRTTKVVVRTTTEKAGAAGAAFSRQPFGIGAWPALALSLGSPIARGICFALLRAIIPGKRPVAPARELFRGSLI